MTSTEKVQGDKIHSPAKWSQPEIYFEHQGREITLLFSLMSGREQVFVDNQPVAQARNWHFRNVHTFEAGGVSYALEVAVAKKLKNIFFGIVDIQLRANGTMIDSDHFNTMWYLSGRKDNHPRTWKRILLWLLPYFAGGMALGFGLGYFGFKGFF